MKKKLNELFDEAKSQDIEQFSYELNAPELPNDVLDAIKSKVYAKTNLTKKKKNNGLWLRCGTIAACLSLIVMGGIFGNLFCFPDTPDVPENKILSYFKITAHAANGDLTDLTCLSSIPGQAGNLFGVDMPTFNFSVTPSDLKINEVAWDRFAISVSYNGSTVNDADEDEHIMIGYEITKHESGSTWAWFISGWFTDPTDIVVNILDKETREIVETFTVNVNYLADKQEYTLKLTNFTTKFSEQTG